MKIRFPALFAALCLVAVSAFAESAADLRRRMEQRLTAIDAFKAQEAIGENNHGFLEQPPAGKSGGAAVIAEENHDREQVYALIAKETGASAAAVGQARAKKIAANSHGGVWVQDEGGQWKKK